MRHYSDNEINDAIKLIYSYDNDPEYVNAVHALMYYIDLLHRMIYDKNK